MSTINLSAADFEKTISQDGLVLLDFWAEWCGPCKSFGPIFEDASQKYPDATFAKIDTEAEQELAGALNIRSIPTLMAFRDGILLFSQPGALPAADLENVITQLNEIDMDDVRAKVAAEQESKEQESKGQESKGQESATSAG